MLQLVRASCRTGHVGRDQDSVERMKEPTVTAVVTAPETNVSLSFEPTVSMGGVGFH